MQGSFYAWADSSWLNCDERDIPDIFYKQYFTFFLYLSFSSLDPAKDVFENSGEFQETNFQGLEKRE